MESRNIGFFLNIINKNLNETKHLTQWRMEINKSLPSNMAMTDRQIAYFFRVIRSMQYFFVDHKSNYYSFSLPEAQELSTPQLAVAQIS